MNLAMARESGSVGFTELNEQEMMWVDGGIDWGGVGRGLFNIVGGLVEGMIGEFAIITEPSYLLKAGGVYALFDGEDRFVEGCNELMNAIKQ